MNINMEDAIRNMSKQLWNLTHASGPDCRSSDATNPAVSRADTSISYLHFLLGANSIIRLSEHDLGSSNLASFDDGNWIKRLMQNVEHDSISDQDRRRFHGQIQRLKLDCLSRKQIIGMNLVDDILLAVTISGDLRSARATMVSMLEIDDAELLNSAGDCSELDNYKEAKWRYRASIQNIIGIYDGAIGELDEVKSVLFKVAYAGIYEMGLAEQEEAAFTSGLGQYFDVASLGSDSALCKYCNSRRTLVPMHRLDKDAYFERILHAHSNVFGEMPRFLFVLEKAELNFYSSKAALEERLAP